MSLKSFNYFCLMESAKYLVYLMSKAKTDEDRALVALRFALIHSDKRSMFYLENIKQCIKELKG